MEIRRIDPRGDLDAIVALVSDHCAWKGLPFDEAKFRQSFGQRMSRDLLIRNGTAVVADEGAIVGLGLFSILEDALGRKNAFIHPPITRKEHAYKVGIEEGLLRELAHYLQSVMKLDTAHIIFPGADRNLLSILMKLGYKKAKGVYFERALD
ncbi:MAG: hypothetical protein ACTSU5_06905 [Promethearchaeota archaeon]